MLSTTMTMTEALADVARRGEEQEALVCEGARMSYGQLSEWVSRLAHGLYHDLGIRQGDKVATLLLPGPPFACLFFALARLGAVVVPLNPKLRRRALGVQLRHAEPTALVTSLPIEEDVTGQAPTLRHVIDLGGEDSGTALGDLMAHGGIEPRITVSPDAMLALLHTSGTTGSPKATMHTHRSLIAPVMATVKVRQLWQRPSTRMLGKQIRVLARYRERLLRAAAGPQIFLSTIGWHTISGVELMLQALLMSDTLVVMPHFHPRRALELVEHERATILIAVPMAYQVMLRVEGMEDYDTSSLIICGTGAAPCPPHLAREIENPFGCAIHIGFGSTETAGGIAVTDLADSEFQRTETVGRPLSGVEVKVVDPQRQAVAPGEVGELVCRSDSVMLGYYRDPEMTSEVIDDEGWYYTGDLAVMDEDGYLRIVGRKKDMIIRGGRAIYPAEIESYLTAHTKIREAAVVGVPAPVGGERIWAFIMLETGEAMTSQEVKDYCGEDLEPYKIPREVRLVARFPRADTGKVQKFKLRQTALEEPSEQEVP